MDYNSYWHRKDERLSWPGSLTHSGHFTHKWRQFCSCKYDMLSKKFLYDMHRTVPSTESEFFGLEQTNTYSDNVHGFGAGSKRAQDILSLNSISSVKQNRYNVVQASSLIICQLHGWRRWRWLGFGGWHRSETHSTTVEMLLPQLTLLQITTDQLISPYLFTLENHRYRC